MEYWQSKAKVAVKLCCNEDPAIRMVYEFEELAANNGHQSTVKEAQYYANGWGYPRSNISTVRMQE